MSRALLGVALSASGFDSRTGFYSKEKEEEKMKTCKERVKEAWASRSKDLKTLLKAEDNYDEEIGYLNEYGLCVDLRADYVRYQFSCGGPQEELRFYKNGDIEFWFLDWGDGACLDVTDDEVARDIRCWLSGVVSDAPWF